MALPRNPLWSLVLKPLSNLGESVVDNVFRDKVVPVAGSVVYCDLAFGYAEHSGIYIGRRRIVQLSSTGEIESVSPRRFIEGKTAISIYVSCQDRVAVGDAAVARRARKMVGKHRDYNLVLDNCHQFSSGCLTGDFENADNFLWMLKRTTEAVLGSNTWRVWDLESEELFG